MKRVIEALLKVRPGPRPDPLPRKSGDAWTLHAPYMGTFLAVVVGAMVLPPADLGCLACGAAIGILMTFAAERRIEAACRAAHYSAPLLVLTLFSGVGVSGGFVLPAGLLLAAALGGVAAANLYAPSVAPLAGRVQWRFEDVYRRHAVRFGVVGVVASVVVVVFATVPVYRILGVALLPLALRTCSARMLSPVASFKLWGIVAAFESVALVLLVPGGGVAAAAWVMVAGETILFIGSAFVIAERTGVNPYPVRTLAIGAGAVAVIFSIAVPGQTVIYLLLAFVLGGVIAMFTAPSK